MPNADEPRALRALTYLAPGIALELFAAVTRYMGRTLGVPVQLASEPRISGPMHGDLDPFAAGAARAELGFLCSPSWLYLRGRPGPSVELVPAGFVFDDPRAEGRPVYFSEVVVRADHPAASFAELEGGAWGYNDTCSLSGYYSTLIALSELGRGEDFFARHVCTGSHAASIEAVLAGEIDGAAVDANVLRRERPERVAGLRVLDTWGPFPIQPIVLRAGLPAAWRTRVAAALLDEAATAELRAATAAFGLAGFAPLAEADFEPERRALIELGRLPA